MEAKFTVNMIRYRAEKALLLISGAREAWRTGSGSGRERKDRQREHNQSREQEREEGEGHREWELGQGRTRIFQRQTY